MYSKYISSIFFIAACGAPVPAGDSEPECLSDPNCPTGGTDSGSSVSTTSPDGGSVDETGNVCTLEFDQAAYNCSAFMVPMYVDEWAFNILATTINHSDACTSVDVCMPWAGFEIDPDTQTLYAHNEVVFDYCRWECQKFANSPSNPFWDTVPLAYEASPGNWFNLIGFDCVVELNGSGGAYPYASVEAIESWAPEVIPGQWYEVILSDSPDTTECPHINSDSFQATYLHPCTNDTCEDQQTLCNVWNPLNEITSRLNSVNKVYTVSVSEEFVDSLVQNALEEVYYCDNGRYSQVGSVWKMVNLVSGEFLYSLGFRSNDYDVRIQKTGSSTVYLLNSVSAMVNAYSALRYETALTITFKRVVSGKTYTYTMNITLT